MSSDFYFRTWRSIMKRLGDVVNTDIEYQTEKARDKHLSDAVLRLTVVLGQYIVLYNEAVECFQYNLQVQKAEYMGNIVKQLVFRIREIKEELEKMEGTHYQFLSKGLALCKHTTYDAEMTTIPAKVTRSPTIQAAIENTYHKMKDIKEVVINEGSATPEVALMDNEEERATMWWDRESETELDEDNNQEKVEEESISPEARVKRDFIAMIIAHEKLRQVIRKVKIDKLKRETWEKELKGTAQPPARYELREKSAKLLQTVFRTYFIIKRKRVVNNILDQILGLNYCEPPNTEVYEVENQKLAKRVELRNVYEKELMIIKEKLKTEFKVKKGNEIAEDYRDRIREWFRNWFESIQFIHDIPNPGCIAILRDEAPDPSEWLEEYEALVKKQQDAQGVAPEDLKFESQENKRIQQEAKKAEGKEKKAEAALLKKMMKHPTLHPGYPYPPSKRADQLLKALNNYHLAWDGYDIEEIPEVKKKYNHEISVQDAYKDVRLKILDEVYDDMDKEHQQLKQALKEDYNINEEEMPQQMTKRKVKKPKKTKIITSEQIADKLEALAQDGWIIDYPKTKLTDYLGDPNFVGEDLRDLIIPAAPHNYEVRALWWQKCEAVAHGFNKILLVGPDGSGKTKLIHAMATINDAVLFRLDPTNVSSEYLTPEYMKTLIKSLLFCAKATQPSLVHIRHIHKLFYTQVPPEEAELQLDLLNKYFIQNLLKKIRKNNKITVIGTCSDPWLARSDDILKQFPKVMLLPNTSYSTVLQLLKQWVIKYRSIPCNFNISSLAHVLQGYSYGCLQDTLNKNMTHERIVKIAAHGLSPMDVYNFILEDPEAKKTEYDLYLKWYWEKTPAGKTEKQHLDDMMEYKEALAAFEAKEAKKAKQAKKSAAKSNTI